MRGNAQPDGRPLGESNSGPIFSRLWAKAKVHWIKFASVGESVVCNAV